MMFEVMALIILVLALALVFKIHRHLTRTLKVVLIAALIILTYISFMNLVSDTTFDLTAPKGIIEAATYHVGGIFSWVSGLWPGDETTPTGRVVEEPEEE